VPALRGTFRQDVLFGVWVGQRDRRVDGSGSGEGARGHWGFEPAFSGVGLACVSGWTIGCLSVMLCMDRLVDEALAVQIWGCSEAYVSRETWALSRTCSRSRGDQRSLRLREVASSPRVIYNAS